MKSIALLLLVSLVGCGTRDIRLQTYPVKGSLMVQGNAAPQAEITLHAATPLKDEMGRDIFPHARVNEDGTFELTTYVPGDGAPAGEYRITVVWRKITIEAGEETFSHDLLFDRYANPLNGQVVKIEAKENQLDPIQLQ